MKRQGIKYLTEYEKRRFLKTLKVRRDATRAYAMYDLMLATGLRLSETMSLDVGDVLGRSKLEIRGKGGKVREVPLNKAIREHLENFVAWKRRQHQPLEPDSPLFLSRNRRRLTPRQVQRDITKWLRVAGIEGHYSPHALRHTVGTELMRKTKNIRLVQEYLGHADISTTQVYTHVTKEELEQAAEVLSSSEFSAGVWTCK